MKAKKRLIEECCYLDNNGCLVVSIAVPQYVCEETLEIVTMMMQVEVNEPCMEEISRRLCWLSC